MLKKILKSMIHKCLSYAMLILVLFFSNFTFAQSEDENDAFEIVKLEVLCKTVQFILSENNHPDSTKLNCLNISALENSIPRDDSQASLIFKIFKNKAYLSYGKSRPEARLTKLIKDLNTELSKLYKDNEWHESVGILNIQLAETKNELLEKIQSGTYQKIRIDSTKINTSNTQTKPINTPFMLVYVSLLTLLLGGGIAFLAWQNQQLKKQILDLEDNFQEKYSRIDNRIDTMTPVKDYQTLLLKFNFLNEQISALIQEVMVLKTRNEYKMSPQELLAKRTEHLESHTYNPDIQIYYGKYRPDKDAFDSVEFRTEPSRDSIYKIEINVNNPEQAVFTITDRSEYHHIALVNATLMLAPACVYENEPYNDSRIITLKSGILERKENGWVVIKKAKIAFE